MRSSKSATKRGGKIEPAATQKVAEEAKQALAAADLIVANVLLDHLERYSPSLDDSDGFSYLLGQVLNRIRKPEDLSEVIGFSVQTLNRWARGLGLPPPITKAAVIALLVEIVKNDFQISSIAGDRSGMLARAAAVGAAKVLKGSR
ncbi:MAG: hypothetical protein R3C30_02765 [Hyphomonadaceae bacterium]